MMDDLASQSQIHQFAPYWHSYMRRMLRHIRRAGLQSFRSNYMVGDGFSDVLHVSPFHFKHETPRNMLRAKLATMLCNLFPISKLVAVPYRAMLSGLIDAYLAKQSQYLNLRHGKELERFFFACPDIDTTVGDPADTFLYGGRKIGKAYLHPILTYPLIAQESQSAGVTSMMEIGGGFGANTHLLLTAVPEIRKVIYLDIPPTLYIGTQYLKHFFGDAVKDYSNYRSAPKISFSTSNEREIYCITPWQSDKVFASVDLFFNAHSFQEMNLPIVQNYADQICRLSSEKASMLLQFYEHTGVPDTVDPEDVVSIFNSTGRFNLLRDPIDLGDGEYAYFSSGARCR